MRKCRSQNNALIRGNRCGAISVIVMITILVTISIGLELVKTSLLEREVALKGQQKKQSLWLAGAGIERAVARLGQSPDYPGEIWNLSAAEIGGSDRGRVTIKVTPHPEQEQLLTIVAVADYPVDSDARIRSRKVISAIRNLAVTESE